MRLAVKAGQAQRAAHREEQHDRPAEAAQRRHRPEIKDRRRCDAEADEIRQAVEFGAKARRRFEEPRDAAVEAVEDAGRDDRIDGADEIILDGKTDRRHPGAQRQQSQDVRHHPVDRQVGQPPHLEPRSPPPRADPHCSILSLRTGERMLIGQHPGAAVPGPGGRRSRSRRRPSAGPRSPSRHRGADNRCRPGSQSG